MKNNKQVLTSILHTAQMGQSGIRTVMNMAETPGLEKELRSQLLEYDDVEVMALHLAKKKGWDLPKVNPVVQTMSSLSSRFRLLYGRPDSTIAGMLIQGNTRGKILGLKNLHRAKALDPAIQSLANRLLELEEQNIRSSQDYL